MKSKKRGKGDIAYRGTSPTIFRIISLKQVRVGWQINSSRKTKNAYRILVKETCLEAAISKNEKETRR
jgi:hypothetical protein